MILSMMIPFHCLVLVIDLSPWFLGLMSFQNGSRMEIGESSWMSSMFDSPKCSRFRDEVARIKGWTLWTNYLYSGSGEDVNADEEKIDEAVNWLQQDPPAGISGAPYDNKIMLSNAVIFRPFLVSHKDHYLCSASARNTTSSFCVMISLENRPCFMIFLLVWEVVWVDISL
ncbi:hypothetical protein H5410_034841 [Solanum commersonii]|uniref:Uncharacterized protein n=1 Tax=Solanum commersonii TaxID=4109 RepID=A0A9J5XZI5_SOLCO|nr:hypothetical protein H5410_034841 [Solanum commersonii]